MSIFVFSCDNEEVRDKDLVPVSGFDPWYNFEYNQPLRDRNFPLLSMIEKEDSAVELINKSYKNDSLLQVFLKRIRLNLNNCEDIGCLLSDLRFSGPERQFIADWLSNLSSGSQFRDLRDNHIDKSGFFQRHSDLESKELFSKVWYDVALGINRIIDVYGNGMTPAYPDIDSISFSVKDPVFYGHIRALLIQVESQNYQLFYQPFLELSLGLLQINGRDESARYVPLRQGANKSAFHHIPTIKWDDFEYSAIVVLGDGPEHEGVPIESLGRFRVRLGAERYHKKMAPLLIMTGGHVKPFQTPFSEAIEMKKVLMEEYKIPEKAIIVDPHARHTTTNLRNVSRLIYQYNIPADKKVLVTTSPSQSSYVTSDKFRSRCLTELKYLPIELLDRVSEYDVAFKANITSLHVDPSDPLDP